MLTNNSLKTSHKEEENTDFVLASSRSLSTCDFTIDNDDSILSSLLEAFKMSIVAKYVWILLFVIIILK